MSVAIMLGVEDVGSSTMMEARRSWDEWTAREPSLAVVEDLLSLPEWTRTAERESKDAAMRSLAKLGSDTGGGEAVAVTALTWALVPGAATIASRLSDLADNIDERVASHLWTSAKTFAWERRRSVAAAILRDTRRGVLAEFGLGEWARRRDRTWSETVCLEPTSRLWLQSCDQTTGNALTELLDLLEDATCAGVITAVDGELLVDLAMAADCACVGAGRGRAGLTGSAATGAVAERWAMTTRSVRRRASKSIDLLAGFCGDLDEEGQTKVATQRQPMALGA